MGQTPETFYIKTYGCQMNIYDSERMGDALLARGLVQVASAEAADVVLLNTCHIREKAAEKIYSDLGRLRPLKSAAPDMVIGVVGCVAQAEGQEIVRRAPIVDMVFGPQTVQDLPLMLDKVIATREKQVRLDFPAEEKFAALKAQSKKFTPRRASAYLTIQEGCDKFCTFCVVPYTRGQEVSRLKEDIVAEAHGLRDAGVCEITLLGQNVNAWACPQSGARLADLLDALAQIEGLVRLRFTTNHPRDMDADLIAAFGENEKLMPYLHLPIQSGSDTILHAMNRQHTVAHYLDIMARLRDLRDDIALSSDFIVGFPGETNADFEATLALIDKVKFAQAYCFKYSPRPGTPAAESTEQVPEAVKAARLLEIQTRLKIHQRAFNEAQIGQVLPVLFEAPTKTPNARHIGQISGRSPYLQHVHVAPDTSGLDNGGFGALYGTCAPVLIEAAGDFSLRGRLHDV